MLKTILNFLPPLFIFVLVGLSYYTYVMEFAAVIIETTTKKILYLCVYHILLIMFLWAFLQTMMKTHIPIPGEYQLAPTEHARLLTYSEEEADKILLKIVQVRGLEISTCTSNGRIRYCKTCEWIKPDRAHHCNTCNKCILKMDHHCPWVYNCVGYSNYKQFVLTLFYGTAWSVFYLGTVSEYLVELWNHMDRNTNLLVVIGFLVDLMSGVFVGVLLMYHIGLVSRNETTLEALREQTFREGNATFDLGIWRNFREVFGSNICCWLVPTTTTVGNGHEFQLGNLIA